MDEVMDIVELNKFNFFKETSWGIWTTKPKKLDHENRRLENKEEILNDLNNVFICIIALFSFSISKEKIDQVVSVVLSELAKKDIERFWSGVFKAILIKWRNPSFLK